MNTKLSLGLAAILLIAGALIAIKTNDHAPDTTTGNTSSIEKNPHSRSARNQPDVAANSFRFLQSVPGLDLNSPPTFASI